MPSRFNPVLSPDFSSPLPTSTTPIKSPLFSSFQSPSTQQLRPNNAQTSKNKTRTSSSRSLSLSCTSPDALSVHTLIQNYSIIQTNTLPLNHRDSKKIQTYLPDWLVSSLHIDPPSELICIDNDTSALNLRSEGGRQRRILLPLLCIYTMKAVYIIQSSIPPGSSTYALTGDDQVIRGKVESVYEPFEYMLQNNSHFSIKRVRPAPFAHLHGGNVFNASPFIPKGCMAMLISSSDAKTHDESHQSQLVLYHGLDLDDETIPASKNSNNVTISKINTFRQLVDFTFLSSSAVSSESIWNGMSVALASVEGEIYTMTPIVFHGMAIPKHLLVDAIKICMMNNGINGNRRSSISNIRGKENDKHQSNVNTHTEHESDAINRRNKATCAYFKDVFGIDFTEIEDKSSSELRKGTYVVTANLLNHSKSHNAASWPITIQGPVYTPSEQCLHKLTSIESLPFSRSLPTPEINVTDCSTFTSSFVLVYGNFGQIVQYLMIPSSINCMPRFAFEFGDDCDLLNGFIDNIGILVEEIQIENDDGNSLGKIVSREDDLQIEQEMKFALRDGIRESISGRTVDLIIDPVDTTMLHHVTKFGVVTITTNALKVMEYRLGHIASKRRGINQSSTSGYSNDFIVKTKAWSSIDVVEDNEDSSHIAGVNVSGDAKIGHVLVALLSDGSIEAINMTAAQYLNEANNAEPTNTIIVKSDEEKEADEALKALDAIPALHEQIRPFLEQISTGLSGMSKIVGGSTEAKDITPGALATFLSSKQSCEQDIIIPLRDLHALVSSRLSYLRSMQEHQVLQVKRLEDVIQVLNDRTVSMNVKKTTIEKNHKILSQRSADILSTARELTPTVTKEEQQYFQDVKRYEVNCVKWEDILKQLQNRCEKLCQNLEAINRDAQINANLNKKNREMCTAMLEGQELKMKNLESKLNDTQQKIKSVLISTRVVDEK